MTEVLYAPDEERIVTTNAWAFLHWLSGVRNVDLARYDQRRPECAGPSTGWAALQRWSAADPPAFSAAVADFAHLAAPSLRLCRHTGPREALVWRDRAARVSLTRDDCDAALAGPPPDIITALRRDWATETLIRPFAELLLHTDLRPDDRLLVSGASWPWLAGLLGGTTLIFSRPDDLLNAAEEEGATILVAAPHVLAEAAFPRSGRWPALSHLRTVVASGGPLSPEARRRIYIWLKADVMLLARTGDTFWGNPLEPVLAQPTARPAFVMPRAEAPAPR
jgi:hypothetical protein